VIVLDASVAAKLILPEPHSNLAHALITDCAQATEPMLAPPLLAFEVANILRQRMVRQALPLVVADTLMADFLAYPIELVAPPGLHQRALAVADLYGLPAAYDAHYVALAQESSCDLWTDDQRLLRLLGGALPFVRGIATYQPPGSLTEM
jgi:predicted nucleic acid-binding protein